VPAGAIHFTPTQFPHSIADVLADVVADGEV
jgi:hypothetical protein